MNIIAQRCEVCGCAVGSGLDNYNPELIICSFCKRKQEVKPMKCTRCNKNIMSNEIIHLREDGSWECDDIFESWTKKELVEEIRFLQNKLREEVE